MKKLIPILILLANIYIGQSQTTSLNFNTKYFEAVDKWVAFPKKEVDTTYTFGFIYLDNQAGFTFNYESNFQIKEDTLVAIPKDTTYGFLKYRLEPNTSLVALLNAAQCKQLGLPEKPEWLTAYKADNEDAAFLTNQGYHYNHVGASHLALQSLLKAYGIEPHFKGLEFELAYAYNALGQFEKSIPILEKAIENNPNDFYFFRELGYTYINLNRVEDAEETYRKGIKISNNDFEKSEMAINMAQYYFHLRNKKKFDEWAKITRKYAEKGSRYNQFIDLFEKEWDKK